METVKKAFSTSAVTASRCTWNCSKISWILLFNLGPVCQHLLKEGPSERVDRSYTTWTFSCFLVTSYNLMMQQVVDLLCMFTWCLNQFHNSPMNLVFNDKIIFPQNLRVMFETLLESTKSWQTELIVVRQGWMKTLPRQFHFIATISEMNWAFEVIIDRTIFGWNFQWLQLPKWLESSVQELHILRWLIDT